MNMKLISDINYGKDGHPLQKLDMYIPDNDSFYVFICIHGGGIEAGDKKADKILGTWVAEHGVAFVSINYRLYPETVYPEFICDAAESVNWVHENISKYGKCKGIYVGGSSAGAYISMMLCFDNKYLAPYNIPDDVIKGYIHDAGQPTTHFNVLAERGIDSRRIIVDEAAPLYHIGTAEKYPPMLFLVSDNDMKNRYEQTQLVLSTLKHFGYDDNKIHYKLMSGTHCNYSDKPEFGEIICNFIESNSK